jgi:regulator of ribonuclease activity A
VDDVVDDPSEADAMTATADILDEHGERALVCPLPLRSFGGRAAFSGEVSTVRCFEDNVVLKRRLGEPGEGHVLVVDRGGSLRVALVGDMIGALARDSGWAGVVINGCVRDVTALGQLDVGIFALASTPRPSAKAGDGEVDVPVELGGVTFRPGDTLYADADGVVVLPR